MPRSLIAALFAAFPFATHAGFVADVEIVDRSTGQSLPIVEHRGRSYVAGEPGHQYEVHLRNRSSGRVLAVTSIDGVNVITGETAAETQSGYVIERWGNLRIDGWRKSLDTVATFYFTRLPDSYAARTGRPDDVGVIGVALFREQGRRHCCMHMDESRAEGAAEATAPRSAQSADRERAESKLGTGHGHQEASAAQYVDFERASSAPDETLVIYYDSRRNLVAQGVLPPASRVGKHRPDPFPAGFAPDPPN